MTYVRRVTIWEGSRGDVVQVNVAWLDPTTWEPLAHATEPVGPFDDPVVAVRLANDVAAALRDGLYAGQGNLGI